MPQPKPLTTYAAGRKRGSKARAPVLDTAPKNLASRVTRSFMRVMALDPVPASATERGLGEMMAPLRSPPPGRSSSHQTHRWREMDSNFRFRASSDYAGVGVLRSTWAVLINALAARPRLEQVPLPSTPVGP
jgi:hypothetical protein